MKQEIPFAEWDGWNDRRFAPNHFFQTYDWFAVLASVSPGLEIVIRVFDDRLALPVFRRRIGPLTLEGSPLRGFFTPYGGFLGGEATRFSAEQLEGDFNEILLPPGGAYADADWGTLKTIVIDLRGGCDSAWAAMRSEMRNKIRKAQKANVTVRLRTDSDWVKPVFAIFTRTYERQGVPLPNRIDFFYSIAKRLVPGSAAVFTAEIGDSIVGYVIASFDSQRSYYLDGGLDREYGTAYPSNILHWEVIRWSVGRGLEAYDMNGANMESIASFKRGYGGEETTYRVKEYTRTLLGRVAWSGYTMLRPAMKAIERSMRKKSGGHSGGRTQAATVGDTISHSTEALQEGLRSKEGER